jgi:hypothetical protein
MIHREYINFQDNLYYLYRKIRSNEVLEEDIQSLKEHWHCDMVIKNKTPNEGEEFLYFLVLIPGATIIDDMVITEIPESTETVITESADTTS